MGQAMETNAMALGDDAANQRWMAQSLVPQAEPSGGGTHFLTQSQGKVRGQGQATRETVQGLGPVIGGAAELEPVFPIEGEGEPTPVQVKFRSERLMNSREKSSSSVWNCLSCPWKKL